MFTEGSSLTTCWEQTGAFRFRSVSILRSRRRMIKGEEESKRGCKWKIKRDRERKEWVTEREKEITSYVTLWQEWELTLVGEFTPRDRTFFYTGRTLSAQLFHQRKSLKDHNTLIYSCEKRWFLLLSHALVLRNCIRFFYNNCYYHQ